jgi:hypothetical protein
MIRGCWTDKMRVAKSDHEVDHFDHLVSSSHLFKLHKLHDLLRLVSGIDCHVTIVEHLSNLPIDLLW